MNYSEIKTAVAKWLARDDEVAEEQIPDFIKLAHSRIVSSLRCPAVESVAGYSLVEPQNFIEIPQDYIAIKALLLDGKPLNKVSGLTVMNQTVGTVTEFARVVDRFYLNTETTGDIELHYYQAADALAEDNDTNSITGFASELYIFGALVEAAPYLLNDARIPVWEGKFQQRLTEIHRQAKADDFQGAQIQGAYQ